MKEMNVKSLRNVLIELANANPSSDLAQILAFYYPTLKKDLNRESVFEFLHSKIDLEEDRIISDLKPSPEEVELNELQGKDFRVKSVFISGLRGIPETTTDDIPYGIDFSENGEPNNSFILANNGVGKSSVFAGLEMVFGRRVGEKELRSSGPLKESDYNKYITRFGSESMPECKVVTYDKTGNLNEPIISSSQLRRVINPSNNFISDYDIYHNGKINFEGDSNDRNSFHSIIANSLGLSEFIDFQQVLSDTANYNRRKESNYLKSLEKERTDLDKSINNVSELLSTTQSEIETLKNSLPKHSSKPKENQDKIKQLLAREMPEGLSEEYINSAITSFKNALSIYQSTDITQEIELESVFLESAEKILLNADDCPLCQNSKSSVAEIRELLSKRIINLKNSASELEEIKSKHKALFETLDRFFSTLRSILNFISNEKEGVRKEKSLNQLLDIEEAFHSKYSVLLFDEELLEYIEKRKVESVFSAKDLNNVLTFLDGPVINELGKIADQINRFKAKRASIIEEWNANNTLESSPIFDLKKLEDELKRLQIQYQKLDRQLEKTIIKIEQAEDLVDRTERIKNELKDYLFELEYKISNIVLESFIPLKNTVESVLNSYLIEDKHQFKIEIQEQPEIGEDRTKKVIYAHIVNCDTGDKCTPDIFFNTFRFKLLGLMINISLALATRKKYKLNLPVIIDDLFASSDYVSKNSFPIFLLTIVRLFKKYTPDMPLQLILMTHDDVVFKGALDLVFGRSQELGVSKEELEELYNNSKIGRMFRPDDKSESPAYFDGQNFWDLFYQFPNPENQLNNLGSAHQSQTSTL